MSAVDDDLTALLRGGRGGDEEGQSGTAHKRWPRRAEMSRRERGEAKAE